MQTFSGIVPPKDNYILLTPVVSTENFKSKLGSIDSFTIDAGCWHIIVILSSTGFHSHGVFNKETCVDYNFTFDKTCNCEKLTVEDLIISQIIPVHVKAEIDISMCTKQLLMTAGAFYEQ